MKKPKNIPTYYNFPGAPVFRDTTALPFKNGGDLDDPENEELPIYTWSGDANSYYRFNETRNRWEYLNNKTRDNWGRYDFAPVKNKKTIKKLENEAVPNSAAKEQLLTWASDPSNYGVSFLVGPETKLSRKSLTFDEKQALKQEYLSKNLPLPSWLSNIGAESLALYFNNVDNMSSDELYKKGMSMGPTVEGAKYLEMAKVQYENEQIKKANSMQKAISESSGWQKGVMGMPTKKRNIEYTPIPLKPLPYAGQAGGKLITKDEKTAREFFDYLKNNKKAAEEIIGRELTEEELYNEAGGYDNFAQTDLYQNFANEKTVDKIEEQKYENFLEENEKAQDEAGIIYNTLDFARSLATDLPATTYNLFQGKMPLYQQSRGLGGEDPDTYNYYKRYTDAGGYGFLNALNDTWRMVAPVANAQDAVINFDKGNYGSSALLGLGAIPLIGSAFKLPGLIRGASALNLTDDVARLAASGENIINTETALANVGQDVVAEAAPVAESAAVSSAESIPAASTGAENVTSTAGSQGWQSGVREIVDNADGSTTFHYNDGSSYVYPADINSFIAQRPANTRTLAQQMGLAESQGVIDLRRAGSANVVDDAVKNMSGYSKEKLLADKSLNLSQETKDAIIKMSDEDFQNTAVKTDGTVVPYTDATPSLEYNFDADRLMVRGATPTSLDDYITQFNANLPRLNEIIATNNKTGIPITVNPLTAITSFADMGALGKLSFSTPTISNIRPNWTLGINPGKFAGKVEDFASTSYYKSLPGLSMINTSAPVFSDFVPRRGSGVYKSINDYLKELELGRVKAGFNTQSEYSSGLWQDAIQKERAHGFFGKPGVVYGAMKTVVPAAVGGGTAGYLLNNAFDQSGYDAYGNMGLRTGGKLNAYGGPLNDRNINGKLLQSTYASPLGNMFREGGPFGEDKGTFDYANSIYASQPGNYYSNGGFTVTRSNDRKGKTHKVVRNSDGKTEYYGSEMRNQPKNEKIKAAAEARHSAQGNFKNPFFKAYWNATWENGGPINTAGPVNQISEDPMNAIMKARLAYANEFNNPAAQRMVVAPDQPYIYTGEEFDKDWNKPVGVPAGNIGTHYMASFENYAVPFIQQGSNGLQFNESPSIRDKEAIRFDNELDADYFSEHYKKVAPDPSYREYRTGGQFPRPYSLPEDSFKQGGKNLHNSVYASSNAQYPAIYKQGGNINVVAGGEKHRVYIKESPTGMGEGVKGHVMVTHPTMDKGKWDTIDLTVKARAKTIEQGIAATKKWHKENPNVYRQGGSVLSMSNTPQLQGEGKDLTYPDNAYIYAGGGLIKRADGSYSQRGLWDNIRANIGSGKKPTKQMLQQEKKINKNYK